MQRARSLDPTMALSSYQSIEVEPTAHCDDGSLLDHNGGDSSDEDAVVVAGRPADKNAHAAAARLHPHPSAPSGAGPAAAPPAPPAVGSTAAAAVPRLSPAAAIITLVKGNLGPGVLNLPRAFAVTGYATGSVLFVVVALQGIHSMWLLVYCKNLLRRRHRHGDRHPRGGDGHGTVLTFMDVAEAALGRHGGRLTAVFLFVLQTGVCCVFLSLVATNLQAALHLPASAAVAVVTLALLGAVLVRFLRDLFWLNAAANAFMLAAVVTATVAGWHHHRHDDIANDQAPLPAARGGVAAAVTFTSDMFFAFEGIGLVLPVENCYNHASKRSFAAVLLCSMACVAVLFAVTGLTASIGFPDIDSASITAYLKQRYPHVLWYAIVNVLVLVAVALTFPLQLTPAMEVLEGWLTERKLRRPRDIGGDDDDDTTAPAEAEPDVAAIATAPSFYSRHEWIARRWVVVLSCAAVVLIVRDLGILVSLVGAIGQTGLAGLPCAIHLSLQQRGIAPANLMLTVVDMLILVFCGFVMVAGFSVAVGDILKNAR